MSNEPISLKRRRSRGLLSIEQLETGLRALGSGDLDQREFWDENIDAFRRTVLVAIRDTSEALLSPTMSLPWRVVLERQLEELVQYIDLADHYLERKSSTPARGRPAGVRLH